ncbi:MAG: D-aminoacylase [Candidatus Aminicenantes bacterium]|nr:D-aminoacylase [Candidatus Aminicenantes bacterium]
MKPKNIWSKAFVLVGMFFLLQTSTLSYPAESYDYDILIKNGFILDGGLGEPVRADVAVKGNVILMVGKSLKGKAARVIDAQGLYVVPGFIDLHSHVTRERLDDGMIFREGRACLNYLVQGVTTVVAGQCGSSGWPQFEKAEDMIKLWSEDGIGPNAALLVGHASVREIVMGRENRDPTPEEMARMKALVKEAMEQGAYGLSTGLVYVPGFFAKTDEVVELVKEIAPYGGIYHTHIRNEGDKLLEAIKEAIAIGEKTGAATHISHLKALGKSNWGSVKEACSLIEEARKRGLKVTADQYPYEFSSINPYQSPIPRSAWLGRDSPDRLKNEDFEKIFDYLRDAELIELYKKVTPFIPPSPGHQEFLNKLPRKRLVTLITQSLINLRNFEGPENARARMLFLKRMEDPEEARKIRAEVRRHIEESVGAENYIVGVCVERDLEGKSLKQVAAMNKKSVEDAAIELELMGAECIPLQISEEDIEYIMKKDYVGTGSDGTTPFYGIGLTHIRSYATFLHKIKKYALERKAVSLAHVIRSQTSLPAQIMNWNDRGWIKEGYKADIAVIDLKNIQTPASISNPHQYSRGVSHLLVNGEPVIEGGRWTGKLPGKILKLKKT